MKCIVNKLKAVIDNDNLPILKSGASLAIKEYLNANGSISVSEKNALLTLVDELIEKNLWDKMIYFYPLLGSNVSDMLLDAIDPLTGFPTDTAKYAVANKMLVGASSSYSNTNIVDRGLMCDSTFISAGICDTASSRTAFRCYGVSGAESSTYSITNFIVGNNSATRFPKTTIQQGSVLTQNASTVDTRSITNRISTCVVSQTGIESYLNGNKILTTTEEAAHTNYKLGRIADFLADTAVKYSFFAIANQLTDSEVVSLHKMIDKFLTAIEKK